MNLEEVMRRMAASRRAIVELVRDIPDADAHWRPEPGSWSLNDVLHHLVDEEREDFRVRLQLTLEDPEHEWPGIDPAAWVVEREYETRALAPAIDAFRSERERSLAWLSSLEDPDWSRCHRHPRFGEMSAAELLTSWAAHDLLHLRQLTRLSWLLHERDCAPASPAYAGDW